MAKTATTFLQQNIYPHVESAYFCGRPFLHKPMGKMVRSIHADSSLFVDTTEARRLFYSRWKKTGREKLIVSDEAFADNHASVDCFAKACVLRKIFGPDASILFTIRNPLSSIKSEWLHYLRNVPGRGNEFRGFGAFIEHIHKQRTQRSAFSRMKYAEIIRIYELLFGRENVTVLCYEDMKVQPDRFFSALAPLLGTSPVALKERSNTDPVNTGLTPNQFAFIKMVCRDKNQGTEDFEPLDAFGATMQEGPLKAQYLKCIDDMRRETADVEAKDHVARAFDLLRRVDASHERPQVELNEEHRQLIYDAVEDGNRYLAKEYELPLEKHGYPM